MVRMVARLGGGMLSTTIGVLLATNAVFVRNGTNGLETSLLTFLCLAALSTLNAETGARWPSLFAKAVTLAALGLTRPDAILLLLALFAAEWAGRGLQTMGRRAAWLSLTPWLACGVVIAIHEIWRWSYYGHPLPNTFYAKVAGESHLSLAMRGIATVGTFLQTIGGVLTIPLCAAAFLGGGGPIVRGLAMLVAARMAFVLFSGGEYMEPHRFMAPTIPLLYALLAVGAARLWSRLKIAVPGSRFALLAAMPLLILNVGQGWAIREEAAHYERSLSRCHIALGHWFASHPVPGQPIAVGDAGAIPFFSGLVTIDLWGLNDEHIAHLPGAYGEKVDLEYLWKRAPAYIVIWSNMPRALYAYNSGRTVHDRAIEQSAVFRRDYVLGGEGMFEPGSYQLVFMRR